MAPAACAGLIGGGGVPEPWSPGRWHSGSLLGWDNWVLTLVSIPATAGCSAAPDGEDGEVWAEKKEPLPLGSSAAFWGLAFLFLRKEILQHHSWLSHLPGFLGQEVKRHKRRRSTIWQQAQKHQLHQRAAVSREKSCWTIPNGPPKSEQRSLQLQAVCTELVHLGDPLWWVSGGNNFFSFAESVW